MNGKVRLPKWRAGWRLERNVVVMVVVIDDGMDYYGWITDWGKKWGWLSHLGLGIAALHPD